jgi:LuxR family maltose regulon positive regulatory protein
VRCIYELRASHGDALLGMEREQPAWFAWLEQGNSFAFEGKTATCLVRRETKQRGDAYWYAYSRKAGMLTKKYVGKTADVTPARLEYIAALLGSDQAARSSSLERSRLQDESVSETLAYAFPLEQDTSLPPLAPKSGDLLLATKLYQPRLQQCVHRPHLTVRLQQRQEAGGVTLLSAPAGYGKTTLVSEWLALSSMRAAWLTLDDLDNDPIRFLSYLIAALQTLQATLGTVALAMLHTSPPPPLETVLTVLINDLVNHQDRTFTFVLDDYHVITAQPIHNALAHLLEHFPPHLHLLITTRTDPPLSLARLRSRQQLTELRRADLQFASSEVESFLHLVMRVNLPPDVIDVLQERIEGWAAGVQLAALSLRGRVDVETFLATFTGGHRYVLEYLSEEVLARQPASVQSFLLHTCVLERLSGPLCDAVTGQTQGQAMLERIERANLFLIPLDEQRQWYRYHHLFAEMMQSQLQKIQPALAPDVHHRASMWFEQHGLLLEAVEHARAASEVERVAHLIEPVARTMLFEHGEIATLRRWIEGLPTEAVRSHPQLFLASIWLLLLTGQIDAAEQKLRDAKELSTGSSEQMPLLTPEVDGKANDWSRDRKRETGGVMGEEFQGEAAAITATIAFARGNLQEVLDQCQQGLQLLPQDNSYVRGMLTLLLGQAYREKGDLVAAGSALAEASMYGRAAENLLLTVGALLNQAELQELQGRLHQAASTRQQVIDLAMSPDGRPLPLAGPAYVGLGKVLREWNDLDGAAAYLKKGRELSQQGGLEGYVFESDLIFALVLQAQQKTEWAFEALQPAQAQAQRANNAWATNRVEAFRARLFLMQGNITAALHWLGQSGLQSDDPVEARLEIEYLMVARVLLVQSRLTADTVHQEQAMEVLRRLLQAAERADRIGSVIEILALQALAYQALGETALAFASLGRALTLAEPEAYVRLFVDEGESMAQLLKGLLEHRRKARSLGEPGFSRHYLSRSLQAFEQPEQIPAYDGSGVPALLEPLSKRELEVLHLLAAGRQNQEIATELVITAGTVKTHLQNLYRKLDVTSRLQAVSRAKALRLL